MGDVIPLPKPLKRGERPKRRTDGDRLADLDRKEANGPVNYANDETGLYAIKDDGSFERLVAHAKDGEPKVPA